MSEYKGIKGFQVQTRTEDPSEGIAGDFYYNSTTGQFKTVNTGGAPIGSWSSGGNMNTSRGGGAMAGLSTAAMIAGGSNATVSYLNSHEQYDGSSWAETTDLNTSRRYNGGGGTQTANLVMGGSIPPGDTSSNAVEQWDGSSWTEIAEINTARYIIQNTGTVTAFGIANVPVTGQQLNVSQGEESIDLNNIYSVTGLQLNTDLGTVDSYNEAGWGRDDWGTEVWGAQGIWETVSLTGNALTVDSGQKETWGQDEWGATTTEWGGSYIAEVDILTIASPTGLGLTSAEGTVDPSPDATVTGIGMTVGVGLGSISGTAEVDLTGIQLNVNLGTAVLDAVTFASPTGQQLNWSIGDPLVGASAEAPVTGIQVNLALGDEVSQIWTIVDTGTSVSYTEVSTGTSVTWNDIDTAA